MDRNWQCLTLTVKDIKIRTFTIVDFTCHHQSNPKAGKELEFITKERNGINYRAKCRLETISLHLQVFLAVLRLIFAIHLYGSTKKYYYHFQDEMRKKNNLHKIQF